MRPASALRPLLTLALLAPVTALVLATAACRSAAADAQRSGQARYGERTLEEWWQLRRDADPAVEADAQFAMHMLGPAAVPFLAAKAAGRDMADVIGSSVALESMCTNAIPAMEAARAEYPSAALDGAIRRVKASASEAVRDGVCTPRGEPTRPGPPRGA